MAFRRLALALAAALAIGSVLTRAQVPGRNVNMVSGTDVVKGDPFLQRQNEPSVAASTRNPLHLLAGANDYRTVDLPFVNGADETGDAWLGLFKSTDGGQRWTSTLLPGYPQDPLRGQSPLGQYGAAADPVVRAGTNGLIYYAGLAFDRGPTGKSGVFVSRFIDDNNRETTDPFSYLGTTMVVENPAGAPFLDKPWLAVDIPRGGPLTCPVATHVHHLDGTQTTEVHNLPAGPVYVAYSAFTGSGSTLRSDIMFAYSTDCGAHWSAPQRLNAADNSLNQGASIAIDPSTGNVYVAWRRFTRPGSPTTDALMIARSVNLGKRFAAPQAARRMPRGRQLGRLMDQILEHRRIGEPVEVEQLSEFDQGSSAQKLQFRTNSYATITLDDKGRIYMAWAERGYSTFSLDSADKNDGDAKILMSTSTNGVTWTAPAPVSEPDQQGHQIMPSLAYAAGKLLLVYYDLRDDVSHAYGPYIDDLSAAQSSGKRHTVDIRASLGTPGAAPAFAPSVRVSDYFVGFKAGSTVAQQLQFNPPNLPMFKQGTTPFFGDYIDISPAPAFVPVGKGGWAYNTAKNSIPVFHAVWTDNRDVRPPQPGTDWTDYTPPYVPGLNYGTSYYDPSGNSGAPAPVCVGTNTGMRNQNVYTARITGGLLVGSPANTKPLSATLQRGFVVFAQNMTEVTKTFRMQIANQPIGGYASFQQIASAPLTAIDVIVPRRSTASRTVYITSSDEHARVTVDVFEIPQVGAPQPTVDGLSGLIILNADIENADIENADIENADIENADIENTELITADIENADIENADIENADIENADIENADIENADIENADIENADIENADIENADIENADIENTAFADAPVVDETWSVTNTGNTTAAFNVNLFLAAQNTQLSDVNTQLILHKSYITPAAASCDLKLRSNTVLVANITHPAFITPNSGSITQPNDPAANNAVLWLAPGEVGKFTLRIRDTDPSDNVTIINAQGEAVSVDSALVPGVTLDPIVVPQEIGTADLAGGVTAPPITTIGGSTMFFSQPPASLWTAGVAQTVSVQVRDKSGAVLPAVDVTLELSVNPTAATLGGNTTVTTDAQGIALFNTLQINTPGAGYRLRARVTTGGYEFITPIESAPFTVRIQVINAADAGPGSLRDAIELANSNAGVGDVITFAIPGAAPHTIAVQSPLPGIDDSVVLDATPAGACTGAAPTVQIDNAGTFQHGLFVNGPGSVIRGLSITGFSWAGSAGIYVSSGGFTTTIECNYIGLAPDGVTARGNGVGVRIGFAANIVGGDLPAQRNVISGNVGNGVLIQGPVSGQGGYVVQNVVKGNFIGTDATGAQARGNGGNGVQIVNAASNTVANNVVSGNTGEGIRIDGAPATANTITGNRIGTGAAGTGGLGNGASGIYVRRAPGNTITANLVAGNSSGFAGIAICGNLGFCGGGDAGTQGSDAAGTVITGNVVGLDVTGAPLGNVQGVTIDAAPGTQIGGSAAAEANIISANGVGIVLFNGANNNTVRGNFIGTDASASANRGNTGAGVLISSGSGNTVGGLDNTNGGGNTILFNGGAGIAVTGGTANKLRFNHIDANVGLGIDLGAAGVTPNDAQDADAGANDLQNWPTLTSVTLDNVGGAFIQGQLNSTPNAPFTLDFYVSTACDASGSGEGRRWVGAAVINTDAGGNATFGATYAGGVVPAGAMVTATASFGNLVSPAGQGAASSTSEFSNCKIAVLGPPTVGGAAANAFVSKTYVPIAFNNGPGTETIKVFANANSCPAGNGSGSTLVFSQAFTGPVNKVLAVTGNLAGQNIAALAVDAAGNVSLMSNCVAATATNAFLWSVDTGGNDHLYEYVVTGAGATTWTSASSAALGSSAAGMKGHLATIGSAQENAMVQSLYPAMGLSDMRAWIGLTDLTGANTWAWITGEPLAYTNWWTANGEPNNLTTEHWTEFYAAGVWNNNTDSNPFTQGYAVEYEPAALVAWAADATGDAGGAGNPDISSVSVVRTGATLDFRVRFASGTFDQVTTLADLVLDTDQNRATGSPGSNAGCVTDATVMGTDYLVTIQNTQAVLYHATGVCNQFTVVASLPATPVADGYNVSVPLSLVGNDDGLINLKVVDAKQIGPNAYTGVLDQLTDANAAPITTTAGGSL